MKSMAEDTSDMLESQVLCEHQVYEKLRIKTVSELKEDKDFLNDYLEGILLTRISRSKNKVTKVFIHKEIEGFEFANGEEAHVQGVVNAYRN
jgi:hypothetical protein